MVKPVLLLVGAIPIIFALLLIIPLTNPEIPKTAIDPNDQVEIEFTKHHLTKCVAAPSPQKFLQLQNFLWDIQTKLEISSTQLP